MSRIAQAAWLAGCLFLGGGCAHFVETQAIEHFASAMQGGDLAALKAATSDSFKQKALRRDEAVQDLKILKLYPDAKKGKNKKQETKTEIVKVEDVSDDEKLVTITVAVGESKPKKLQYRLARADKNGRWLVDDVLVKQERKELTAAKSVTEQMDLLLSVRDFLDACASGDRAAVLAVCTPPTSKLLGELSPEQLKGIVQQLIGDKHAPSNIHPEAQLDGSDAVVRLKLSAGELVVTFKLLDEHWRVDDASIESKKDKLKPPTMMKMAGVLWAADRFLVAYQADDKPALKQLCAENLFEKSLRLGDLKSVPLPAARGIASSDQVRISPNGADVVFRGTGDMLKISLVKQGGGAAADAPAEFRVQEVTLYDATQERRLSALFTSQAIVRLFSEALINRDLVKLRKSATSDFNQRIWDKLDAARLAELPMPEIEAAQPHVLATVFHGEMIEVTVQQGTRSLTYVLRDWSGHVDVDDVLMPVADRPNSLKATLELMLPIHNIMLALRAADSGAAAEGQLIEFFQQNSSTDFNHIVWTQTEHVPASARLALPHLRAPLTAMARSDEQALVTLGDNRFGARITLTCERSRFVVDQVELISGPEESQRAELKLMLRNELAGRTNSRPPATAAADPMLANPIDVNASAPIQPVQAVQSAETFQVSPVPTTVPEMRETPQPLGRQSQPVDYAAPANPASAVSPQAQKSKPTTPEEAAAARLRAAGAPVAGPERGTNLRSYAERRAVARKRKLNGKTMIPGLEP